MSVTANDEEKRALSDKRPHDNVHKEIINSSVHKTSEVMPFDIHKANEAMLSNVHKASELMPSNNHPEHKQDIPKAKKSNSKNPANHKALTNEILFYEIKNLTTKRMLNVWDKTIPEEDEFEHVPHIDDMTNYSYEMGIDEDAYLEYGTDDDDPYN